MKADQKIYKQIGEQIWSIMPEDALVMTFKGGLGVGTSLSWSTRKQEINCFPLGGSPREVEDKIKVLIAELRQEPPFNIDQPFNHYTITLTDAGKFNLQVAWVDEEDSWTGVFMKGVSDLTWEEAEANYIPSENWEEHCRRFGKSVK